MNGIYKITFVGIAAAVIISCLMAKAFAAEGAKDDPIIIESNISAIADFNAQSIKNAVIDDEAESYSGEKYIAANGNVNHPQWFEGDKLIKADSVYYLVKAEQAPEYYYSGSAAFSNFIDVGSRESEVANKFDVVYGSEPQQRIVGDGYSDWEFVKDTDGCMQTLIEFTAEKGQRVFVWDKNMMPVQVIE